MSWVTDDGKHEGWVADVLADGRLTSSSTGSGVLVPRGDRTDAVARAHAEGRSPGTDDMYEVMSYDHVVGWQTCCECGWRGPRWDRAATVPATTTGHPWRGADSEDAVLADGTVVEDAAHAAWLAHTDPFEAVSEVEAAAAAYVEGRRRLDSAVATARSRGATWDAIGRAAGVTRQTAHERWGTR